MVNGLTDVTQPALLLQMLEFESNSTLPPPPPPPPLLLCMPFVRAISRLEETQFLGVDAGGRRSILEAKRGGHQCTPPTRLNARPHYGAHSLSTCRGPLLD